MGSLSSIIAIAVVVIASVAGVTFAQKKEQARMLIAQEIAKYQYRANEAGRILENFACIPIGVESRKLLLQYAQLNLIAASRLKPSNRTIARNLASIQTQLEDPSSPVDSQTLAIPQDPTSLDLIISKLSTLGKYLQKFQAVKAMNSPSIPVAINKLNLLISEIKISAFVQQAKSLISNNHLISAQKNLQTARQMLGRLASKNNRLIKIEQDIETLISKEIAPKLTKTSSANTLKKQNPVKNPPEDNDIFGPRKKW